MSKGILINALDTYIGTAIYEELLGQNPDECDFELYGTYHSKETSEKPKHIKKMLKRKEKPGLFRKYMLDNMDHFVYDLHSGKLEDLEWGVKALTKAPLESEKTLIVISSVLSWGCNPHYIVEDKPEAEDDIDGEKEKILQENSKFLEGSIVKEDDEKEIDEIDEIDFNTENNGENDGDNRDVSIEHNDVSLTDNLDYNEDHTKITKKKKKIKKIEKIYKEVKYKRIGYSEEEYDQRIPIKSYQKIKEYEDYLLNLQVENLRIFIICAGIPYGNCQTVFNYFFKSAWLQNPEFVPYFSIGDNLIPTIHVKDLAKIVKKMLISSKPEGKYIFAVDQTEDKSMKAIASSISREIGSGKTKSVEQDEYWVRSLNFSSQDYFIDPKVGEKNKLTMTITDNELKWEGYLGVDIMLKPSKFIDEDFEWHCKEGISPVNMQKLLSEFCVSRKLIPIKIILNCSDRNIRLAYAHKLSKFFNIPILSMEKTYEMLKIDEDRLSYEERIMKTKYIKLKERMQFLQENPNFKNEENLLLYEPNEITIEALKYLLKENSCLNRGYVLEGIPINLEEVERLYYKRVELAQEDQEQVEEDEEEPEVNPADSMTVSIDEKNIKNQNISNNEEHEEYSEIPERSNEDNSGNRESFSYANKEDKSSVAENRVMNLQANKKKKIKPKVYKKVFEKDMLPHSVITLCIKNQENHKIVSNHFWQVENFYQRNKIEVLNLLLDGDKEEIFEMMRIYIERIGRPFNYFADTEESINEKRMIYLKEKNDKNEIEFSEKKKKEEELELEKENNYWAKMSTRIEDVKLEKEDIDGHSEGVPVRKFLLLNIMPILTKGMLEVCKINPIDPIDYLADFLFTNSNDYN